MMASGQWHIYQVKTGMKRFVKSKGEYNPQDALGNSAQDYYDKFSGEA